MIQGRSELENLITGFADGSKIVERFHREQAQYKSVPKERPSLTQQTEVLPPP